MWKFSVAQGLAGNTLQSAPGFSLGGYMSTTIIQNGVLNNVFPSVNQDALAQNSIDFSCIFLHNLSMSATVTGLQFWVGTTSSPNFSLAAAVDGIGATNSASSSMQATTIPTRYIAPSNVGYFIFPETQSQSLSLPNLLPNCCVAVWIQRTLLYSGPMQLESIALNLTGMTAT